MPYNHTMMYNRPASDNGMTDVWFAIGHTIAVMDVKTIHWENTKVCSGSFVDATMYHDSLMPNCQYQDSNAVRYDDSVWKYDIGELLNQTWYGTENYWGPLDMNTYGNYGA